MRLIGLTAVLTFLLDQATKYLVVIHLNLRELLVLDVAPPFLTLRMVWNRGVNFGIGAGDGDLTRWGLTIMAIVISGAILWWARKEGFSPRGQLSAGLLVGGALGNAVDRVVYGAVADFLNMSCCGFYNPFSFNVADITIFMGAIGLVLFTGNNKST